MVNDSNYKLVKIKGWNYKFHQVVASSIILHLERDILGCFDPRAAARCY